MDVNIPKPNAGSEIRFVLFLSTINTVLCEFIVRISNPQMLINELRFIFSSISVFNGCYVLETEYQVRAWLYIVIVPVIFLRILTYLSQASAPY